MINWDMSYVAVNSVSIWACFLTQLHYQHTLFPKFPVASLDPNIASNSSRNMTHGLQRLAVVNILATDFSDSPTCAKNVSEDVS